MLRDRPTPSSARSIAMPPLGTRVRVLETVAPKDVTDGGTWRSRFTAAVSHVSAVHGRAVVEHTVSQRVIEVRRRK